MRGVILGPRIERLDGDVVNYSAPPDAMLLRQCVLYWDLIDWPRYSMVGDLTPEAKLLQAEGVLISTDFPQPRWEHGRQPQPGDVKIWEEGPGGGEASARHISQWDHVKPQALTFVKNNADGSGLWSLAQPNAFLVLPPGEEARTLQVELYRAVPVPVDSVPIEVVLDFRRRRSEELLAYRGAIDDLYLEIVRSPDRPFAEAHAIDKIRRSVIDLHRVFGETNTGWLPITATIALNPIDLWKAVERAAVGYMVGGNISPSGAAAGVALGIASTAIQFRFERVTRLPNIPSELSAYAYLASIEAEFGHRASTP